MSNSFAQLCWIYYVDKIQSLKNIFASVCRNGNPENDMPYTTRFNMIRRRFTTHQNTYLVIAAQFCIQSCLRLIVKNFMMCHTLAEYFRLGEKFHTICHNLFPKNFEIISFDSMWWHSLLRCSLADNFKRGKNFTFWIFKHYPLLK